MATLGKPYPFPKWEDYGRDFERYLKESDEALLAIPANKRIQFAVADGHAFYYVESLTPLVLRHIDYLDGYQAAGYVIQGLLRKDVEKMIVREARLAEIFKQKGKQNA